MINLTGHPSYRDEKFFLQVAKDIWSGYMAGYWAMSPGVMRHNGGRSNGELRAYAVGAQTIEKYRSALKRDVNKGVGMPSTMPNGSATFKKAVRSINWDNLKFFPNLRGIAIAKMRDILHDPRVRVTDSVVNQKKALMIAREKFMALPEAKALADSVGLPPSNASAMMIDVIEKAGGFSLPIEAMLTELTKFTIALADTEIEERLCQDIFDLNAAAISVMQSADGKEIVRYVDVENVVIPTTDRFDRANAPYAAWWERMSVEEIVTLCGDASVAEIIKHSSATPTVNNQMGIEGDSRPIVVHGYVRCLDMHRYVNYQHPLAEFVFSEVGPTSGISNTDKKRYGKEIVEYGRQMVYKFSWIVGTDYVFNYGVNAPVARTFTPGGSEALLPLVVYIGNTPSVMERCVGIIDDIQLAVLKKRVFIASLPPGPRISVDMSAIEETIQLGDETMTMADLLGGYQEKGVLLYRSRGEFGDNMNASNKNPVSSLNVDITTDLQLFTIQIAEGINSIRQHIGVNEVVDGTANTQDMLIGVMKGMEAASNKALSHLFRAKQALMTGLFRRVACGWQAAIASGLVKLSDLPIRMPVGYEDMSPLDAWVGIDISVETIPAETDIQFLQQLLLQRIGEGAIDEGLGMMAMNLLRERKIAQAQILMATASKKAVELRHQQQMELSAANAQASAEAGVAVEQARQQTIVTEYQQKKQLLQMQIDAKMQTQVQI